MNFSHKFDINVYRIRNWDIFLFLIGYEESPSGGVSLQVKASQIEYIEYYMTVGW